MSSLPIGACATAALLAMASTPAGAAPFEFGAPSSYEIASDSSGSPSVEGLAIGDVDGDGSAEIIVATTRHSDPPTDYHVFVYRRESDGTMTQVAGMQYGEFSNSVTVALEDLDSDGDKEILVGHLGGLDVFAHSSGNTFIGTDVPTDDGCNNLLALDVDRDGHPDVVCQSWSSGATILHGDGNGGFDTASPLPTLANGYNDMDAGDVTGDGLPDLVLVSRQSADWYVHPHDGVDGFVDEPIAIPQPGDDWSPAAVEVADFNGDGRMDVAVATPANTPDAMVSFYHQQADGSLGPSIDTPSYDLPKALVAVDLDRNGETDLLVGHHGWNKLGRYMQDEGRLSDEVLADLPYQGNSYDVAAGDIDGDGCMDAAAVDVAFGFSVVLGSCGPRAEYDFDGNGTSDVLWRHGRTGQNVIWKGADYLDPQPMASVRDQDWQVSGIGDFNGDRRADVLWRHVTTGHNAIWKSGDHATQQPIARVTRTSWRIVAVADFNGDKQDDIFWRDVATGKNAIWQSADYQAQEPVIGVTGSAWHVVAAGDFNGDRVDDLVWRDRDRGTNAIWLSGDYATQQDLMGVSASAWNIVGAGDFDGNGIDDLLWRNTSDGRNAIWLGGNYADQQGIAAIGTEWAMEAIGDHDGDGVDDIAWRNHQTGKNVIWKSGNAAVHLSMTDVTSLEWQIVP